VVELPDEEGQPSSPPGQANDEDEIEGLKREDALQGIIKRQDETIEHLRHELEARGREIQELHVLLQQAQATLPAPKDNRPWWHRLWRRD
jgi:predicted RNase H-like nuclease (RuvC/YqgF family)